MSKQSPSLSDRERAVRQKLKDDFQHYAQKCLRIRTKSGAVVPFELNKAQLYIHGRLEAQKQEKGRVRALVLKGRQQGCSTYIGGRFYHRTTHSKGLRTFILTHEDAATQNLFEMVNRYHDHCPALVRPATGAANAKELYFSGLDSGYKIGTAGTKGVGRSSTLQLFHGSEVAFWPHADTHAAGVLQAVADMPGTEVVLESTANGLGNYFHKEWQKAERGEGDFIAIFVPWFWQEEYRKPVPPDFVLTDEEAEYKSAYGLDDEQMAWRRNKVSELQDETLFKQEYPATAQEAFQMSGHDSFIKPEDVVRARKLKGVESHAALVCGADPARFGDDRFSVAFRRGRVLERVESKSKIDVVAGANWLRQIINEHKPKRMFVDVGGLGAGVVDILHSWGDPYSSVVVPVNFGGSPQDDFEVLPDGEKRPGAKNRRAEMWMRSRSWLTQEGGASIPDMDSLQADACGPTYGYDVNQRLVLESKEHMRQRGVVSPDEWDAVALTFAESVPEDRELTKLRPRVRSPGAWMGA
jgi:hypothetical protein